MGKGEEGNPKGTDEDGTVWREDGGISMRVQQFYPPSERRLAKVRKRDTL